MSNGKYKKTEGGQGGKKGHSNMVHYDGTEQIKHFAKKLRRSTDRKISQIRQTPE